jgi:hypothetical protein
MSWIQVGAINNQRSEVLSCRVLPIRTKNQRQTTDFRLDGQSLKVRVCEAGQETGGCYLTAEDHPSAKYLDCLRRFYLSGAATVVNHPSTI